MEDIQIDNIEPVEYGFEDFTGFAYHPDDVKRIIKYTLQQAVKNAEVRGSMGLASIIPESILSIEEGIIKQLKV